MLRRLSSAILAGILLSGLISGAPVYAKTKQDRQEKHGVKVKNAVTSLGVGEDTRITVKLNDKTTVNGFIQEIRGDGFLIADPKSGNTSEVAYTSVKQLKGHNLSTGAKVAIGVGIAVAVLAVLVIIGLHYGD